MIFKFSVKPVLLWGLLLLTIPLGICAQESTPDSIAIGGTDKAPDKMWRIYSDLHDNLLDVFNEQGVQIMPPAYFTDPDQPKLVSHDV